jgi:hypothetical protein
MHAQAAASRWSQTQPGGIWLSTRATPIPLGAGCSETPKMSLQDCENHVFSWEA